MTQQALRHTFIKSLQHQRKHIRRLKSILIARSVNMNRGMDTELVNVLLHKIQKKFMPEIRSHMTELAALVSCSQCGTSLVNDNSSIKQDGKAILSLSIVIIVQQ